MHVKAKNLTEGQFVIDDAGEHRRITEVMQTRGFRMSLEGHPIKSAVMICFGRDYSLCHPDAEIVVAR